jgi:hypothetical protein
VPNQFESIKKWVLKLPACTRREGVFSGSLDTITTGIFQALIEA